MTEKVSVPPAWNVVPAVPRLHWEALPLRLDGFPGIVSQIRTGATGTKTPGAAKVGWRPTADIVMAKARRMQAEDAPPIGSSHRECLFSSWTSTKTAVPQSSTTQNSPHSTREFPNAGLPI